MMRINCGTFATALRSVLRAASKDKERPHLRAVNFVRHGEDEVTLRATNGHMLAQWRIRAVEASGDGPRAVTFVSEDVEDSLRGIGADPLVLADVNLGEGRVRIGDRVFLWRTIAEQLSFPAVDAVIPNLTGMETPLRHIGVTPKAMREAMQIFPAEAVGVTAHFTTVEGAIYLASEWIDGLEVVLMPCHVSEPDYEKIRKAKRAAETTASA